MGVYQKGKATSLKREKYPLSETEYVNVRELSATELVTYQKMMGDKDTSNLDFVFSIVAKCVVDDDGNPLFDSADDVKNNFQVGLSALVAIQEKVMQLSGLTTPKN